MGESQARCLNIIPKANKDGSDTTAMHFPEVLVQQMGALVASEDSIYIVSHVDVTMDIGYCQ